MTNRSGHKDKEDIREHFDLNAKDYNDKIGTGEHGMMHYGDHSVYERNFLEKVLYTFGLVSMTEMKSCVKYRVEALAEKAGIDENDLVLDSGCGRGGNAIWIAENTGAKVIGLDIDEKSIEKAREKVKEHNLGDKIEFVVGSFDDLPVEGFDVYFGLESQCYSKDSESLLQQVYESMNPGGRIIISDGFRMKRFNEKDEKISDKMHKGWGVEFMFNKDDFEEDMEKAGFENIEKEELKDKIAPTSKYLHRIGIVSKPYVQFREKVASISYIITDKLPLGAKEKHRHSKLRYSQVDDLLTTCRYQYIAGKKGIFDQIDFYGEKPE